MCMGSPASSLAQRGLGRAASYDVCARRPCAEAVEAACFSSPTCTPGLGVGKNPPLARGLPDKTREEPVVFREEEVMVDSGRKHGPFDFRYPVPRKIATPVWELQRDRDGPARLEWSVFLARFFPSRRPHDFEALAAYDAYRHALDRAASTQRSPTRWPAFAGGRDAERAVISSPPRAKRVPVASGAVVASRTASPSSALADWESEGGAW